MYENTDGKGQLFKKVLSNKQNDFKILNGQQNILNLVMYMYDLESSQSIGVIIFLGVPSFMSVLQMILKILIRQLIVYMSM